MHRGVQGAEAQLWLGQPSATAHACQPIAAAGKSRGHVLPAPGLCAACPGGHMLPAPGARAACPRAMCCLPQGLLLTSRTE